MSFGEFLKKNHAHSIARDALYEAAIDLIEQVEFTGVDDANEYRCAVQTLLDKGRALREIAGSLTRQLPNAPVIMTRTPTPPSLPVDRSARTLADGSPVTDDHRIINPATGLQKDYVVLSEEERKRGFVRPFRDSYRHVGRQVCGRIRQLPHAPESRPGENLHICIMAPGHEWPCEVWKACDDPNARHRALHDNRLGGCGKITIMSRPIAETYARDPFFYVGTFCVHCRIHLPVGELGEFTWYEMDGTEGPQVGT